jgi:hypothetical protein
MHASGDGSRPAELVRVTGRPAHGPTLAVPSRERGPPSWSTQLTRTLPCGLGTPSMMATIGAWRTIAAQPLPRISYGSTKIGLTFSYAAVFLALPCG